MRQHRRALGLVAILALSCVIGGTAAPQSARPPVTFFAIGDPQINIPRWGTAGTEATIEAMNALPGTAFPFGGAVERPRGVLIAGDLIDDISNPENWNLYATLFDPAGRARLRFPVFEGAGNHDLDSRVPPGTFTYVQADVIARNRRRPGPLFTDREGYHYAWDWERVHFVCLNVFPGTVPRAVYGRVAPWNDPKGALAFLSADLQARVGRSGRPVVLYWHYGLRGWGLEQWWLPEDLEALARTIASYNVVLILHGHEHRFERYTWNGIDVVMAPSPQFDPDPARGEITSRPKGFLVARLTADELQLANRTPEGWQDAWRKPVTGAR